MKTTPMLFAWTSGFSLVFVLSVDLAVLSGLAVAKAAGPEAGGPNPAQQDVTITARTQDQSAGGCTSSLVRSLNQALTASRTAQARQLVSAIVRCRGLDSDLLLQAGLALIEKEHYPEAAEVFGRCVQDYPRVFECHYNLALAQFAQGRPSEALTTLQEAPHASREQEFACHNLRGKIYEALSQTDQGEQNLSAAFSGAPREENYALDLGLFYIRQRAYAKAAEIFERGARYHPDSPFLLLGISLAQFMGGHEAESVETSRKLLALDPGFSPARLLMAFALYIGGRYGEAEKIAAEGLRAERPHPYLYYLHAATLLRLQSRDYDRMLQELALASSSIPRCSLCYFTEGKVYQAMDNTPAAIADLERAVAADPGYSEAWYRLAALYERAGRPKDAARSYARFQDSRAEKSARETELIRELFVPKAGTSEKYLTPY